MMTSRATTVVLGQIVLAADGTELELADALGILDGRVVAAGSRHDVLDAAAAGARMVDVRDRAVVPGLHDFHLHLVNLARARREVQLDDVASPDELVKRVAAAARQLPAGSWVLGRGWSEAMLPPSALPILETAAGSRPASLVSHDGHSLWASRAGLALAGITAATPDPPGGRVERDERGEPSGVLRERAMAPLIAVTQRLEGDALAVALRETADELARYGITGATEAGDYDAANGVGPWAEFGDSFSHLADGRLDGRLRLTLDIPAFTLPQARERGVHSGSPLGETTRVGWAKLHADGALGSRTAAVFQPYACGSSGDTGIMRATRDELDALLSRARLTGISMAIHAIGDRAVAVVLDAYGRAPARADGPPDRIEHAQLVRIQDLERFAALDVTASLQPVHCPSDRASVEACWPDRLQDAYRLRSLAHAGARLAFGSDAPIEPADPWLGMFAAVHRRYPHEAGDWHPAETLDVRAALSAYTLGPARSFGRSDEGHLRVGAVADLAVLDIDLDTLLAADERLTEVRSVLTLVGGQETHRS
jgi:predicted amidohydrolase YtcJ